MPMNRDCIRLGTRASALARWQANWVTARLQERGIIVEQVLISTQGDVSSQPLGTIGGQGLFTKEIQRALLEDKIDLAVHSLKDLPTDIVPGLMLAAVPVRESTGDVLVTSIATDLAGLPQGAIIGTGSARRKSQLLHVRPDLDVRDIRGNVDTRLHKLDEGWYQAIVLAEAGLRRLGWQDRITQVIPRSVMLPAVGQGALGLETRETDTATRDCLAELNDNDTRAAVLAERAMLAALRAGCLAPVGAWGRVESGRLRLDAAVLSQDGSRRIEAAAEGDPADSERVGQSAAEDLSARGAAELIASIRAPD